MITLICVFQAVLGLSAQSASDVDQAYVQVLSLGQIEKGLSVPDELRTLVSTTVSLVDALEGRDEVFPSQTPLPVSLPELPDLASLLVGFYDNDLPFLWEHRLLELLDGVFDELGLDPKEVMPPDVYAAVSWRGNVPFLFTGTASRRSRPSPPPPAIRL